MSKKRKEKNLLDNPDYISGIFRRNEKGFGFVSVEGEEEEIYISPKQTLNALNGDTVLIKVYDDIKKYPLKRLLDNGVHATLNTDNRTVSNTCLLKERSFVKDKLGLTDKDIELMENYSEKAAFNIG